MYRRARLPHGHRRHGDYVGAMRMTLLVLAAAIVGLGLTLWGVAAMWKDLGVNMTLHGWIAYGLGGVVSLLLAGGLFFLTFKSARDGYDDIDRPEDLNE